MNLLKKVSIVLIITLIHQFIITSVFGQTPEMFKYQAVLRDASGNILANQNKTVIIDILKNSPSGTSVFTESHSVTTTAQGLINLKIGSDNTTGLALIDWTADEYFIQITVDGIIMGTSQLLSVPYALTAKTVENVDYSQIIGKPVNATITTDGFMSSADKTKLDGLQNANITAGTGISVTGTYPDLTITNTAPGATPLVIGQSYGGGIIFWLDATGQHGLIASTADQSAGIQWYNGTFTTTGATLDAVYAGKTNTNLIIANQGAGSYAAQLCANYSVTVNNEYYDDWYLPSKYELNLLYLQKTAVGGFASADYWSSTEYNNNFAWEQYFANGYQDYYGKNLTFYVRAVRAF